MKRLIALILIFATLMLSVGCKKEKYPEIESTEEEARVMMSFSIGGEKYDMKYELYRALFLNWSSHYDNGDKSFWEKEESKDELAELNEKILQYTLDIFAVLHVAKSIGFDPYSDEAEEIIADYIEQSVEGDGDTVLGFDGDYDAYIDSLKAQNMNYSVHKLLLRYSIAYDKIITYYEGTSNENNPSENQNSALSFTTEDVYAFYNSENAVRVSAVITSISQQKAQEIRDAMASAASTEKALEIAINKTTSGGSEITNGVVIGTHSLDKAYYSEATYAAFALDLYETSKVITVITDKGAEYWILYKQEKSKEHFQSCYTDVVSVYISQMIGEKLETAKNTLKASLYESNVYKNLNHSEISMK